MGEKIRVAMVGCGGMSAAWLSAVAKRHDVEIVALVDLYPESARKRQEEFGLPHALISTDLKQSLETLKPDAVFDCTIPASHCKVTLEALEHGCHVLGEKPLSDSMANAVRMVKAAKRAGKIYAVIQNRRYTLPIRGFQQFLKSGQIGDLTTLNSDFYIGVHFGGFRDHMKHVLLLDMAIHTFDQARFLTGADPVAVYCYEWNPKGSWYDQDASAIATFEMTGGLIYTYRGSWCSEGLSTSWECAWRAIGDKGSASWDGDLDFKAQAVNAKEGFRRELVDLDVKPAESGKQGGHEGLINEFLDCVRHGGTPETVCTDNIKSLAMVFGAIESAETKNRVEIHIPDLR